MELFCVGYTLKETSVRLLLVVVIIPNISHIIVIYRSYGEKTDYVKKLHKFICLLITPKLYVIFIHDY